MADRGFLEMVWNHILPGAELQSVARGAKATTLGFTSPSFRKAFDTSGLLVELRSRAPLACTDEASERIELERLQEMHALAVAPPLDEPTPALRLKAAPRCAEGGPFQVVSLELDGELGAITTAEGKRLSQMKLASVAQKAMFAAQGIASVGELNARKDEALSRLEPLLASAGFEARNGAWWRGGSGVTQVIELVNSRWNTFVAVCFHFRLHVVAGDVPSGARSTVSALYDRARPVVVRTSAELLGHGAYETMVTQTTTVDDVAAELQASFAEHILPWLDQMNGAEAIAETLAREHPTRPSAGGHK